MDANDAQSVIRRGHQLQSGRAACLATAAVGVHYLLRRARRSRAPGSVAFGTVAVGTTNACKVSAVRRALELYPEVACAAAISAHKVSSGISEQPMSLDETVTGARNRASAAHAAETSPSVPAARILGIGIESGLTRIDDRHYDVCVVACYDGAHHHLGLSCAFEIPLPILKHVLNGLDLSQAGRLPSLRLPSAP